MQSFFNHIQGMMSQKNTDHQPQLPCDVAVIIPCHNYAHLLPKAIESILQQTRTPRDILVIDDASNDHPEHVVETYADRGVRYMRTDHHSLSLTRNLGATLTSSEFLLFCDPDDRLPPEYIEKCLSVMDDRRVGASYGDLQYFGEKSDRIHSPMFDKEGLLRSNFISSHALIRRQTFDLVGGYRAIDLSLEDWDFYRRIVQAGYRIAKAPTFVLYNIHSDSMVQKHNRDPRRSYCGDAALTQTPVTIFTPFAGRKKVFAAYRDALLSMNIDPSMIHLHWYNTSDDTEFDEILKNAMPELPFAEIRYTHAPLPETWLHSPDSLIRKRIKDLDDAEYYYQMAVVRAYNHMIQTCSTEYVLTLEDDMAIAPYTLRKLIESLEWNTAAVIAPYKSGFFPRYEVWTENPDGSITHSKEKGVGTEEVGGCGFGCTLFRMSDLKKIAPIFTDVKSRPMQWYDQLSYLQLKEHGKILCNWDAEALHMKTERFAEGLATTYT